MTHEELEEAIPLYAIGALERSERQAIEAHLLSGCATCHAALKEYQTVASHLPFGLTPATPPNTLKAKIMSAPAPLPGAAELEKSAGRSSLEPGEWMTHLFPPITPVRSWPFQLAAGFAGLAILGMGYMVWLSYSQSSERAGEIQQLQAAVQQATARVAALQTDLQQRQQAISALKAELDQHTTEAADLRDQLIHREAELEDVRAQLTQRESSLQRLARHNEAFAGFFKNPASKVVSLSGSDMAKSAGAFILFDPVTKKGLALRVQSSCVTQRQGVPALGHRRQTGQRRRVRPGYRSERPHADQESARISADEKIRRHARAGRRRSSADRRHLSCGSDLIASSSHRHPASAALSSIPVLPCPDRHARHFLNPDV